MVPLYLLSSEKHAIWVTIRYSYLLEGLEVIVRMIYPAQDGRICNEKFYG
jgi:hypothetical protein